MANSKSSKKATKTTATRDPSNGKFTAEERATFGFTDEANLDKGPMWPTSFAVTELTPAEEKKLASLVKKAVS